MTQKLVTITIDESGNCDIDLSGFNGNGCSKVAAEFTGKDIVKKSTVKQEFYQQVTSQKAQVQK
jgi:hypothetical protein